MKGRVLRQPKIGASAFQIAGDTVTATNDSAWSRAVGETDPRLPLVIGRIVQRAAVAILPRVDDRLRRDVDVRLLVVDLIDRLSILPTQAEIDRQVRKQLPVVLRKETHRATDAVPSCRSPRRSAASSARSCRKSA